MTRSDLLVAIARRTNKNSTLDTATQNRLVDFLNQRQRRILSIPGTQRLREATLGFSSVASTAQYAFQGAVSKIKRVMDTTNDRVLAELSLDAYRHVDPDPESGTPTTHFIWLGRQPVQVQPSNASTMYVKSTAAGDTTQTATIEGITSEGFLLTIAVTLTGTTAVAMSGYTFTQVTKFYLSATCVGAVTLHEDSGSGTQLAYIPIGKTSQDSVAIILWPTPSAVVTYTMDIERNVSDLAASNDVPALPEDFHDLLMLGALMDEYQHMNDERYAVAAGEYRERERAFRYWLAGTATGAMYPTQEPSRLGPWYPAGS